MFKQIQLEAKSQAEAIEKAAIELKVSPDKIKVGLIEEKKGLLGLNKINVYLAIAEINLAMEGKSYLESIINSLELSCMMDIRNITETEIQYRIQTNNNAILIGKNGNTLMALQKLLKNYLQQFVTENLIVSIDVGHYNDRRIKQLEILATKTAKEVAKTKVEVRLDNLSSFDRRVIHAKLSEWKDVSTISEGIGETRVLIIKPN